MLNRSVRLEAIASLLTGVFRNPDQALENPAWFVHLQLWQRRTPLFAADSVTLFLEQANVLYLDRPYRQRLLRLTEEAGQVWGQYYQFQDFSRWRGCGEASERLQGLMLADVAELPGCRVAIAPVPTGDPTRDPTGDPTEEWQARLVPGGCCEFEYEGQKRQVLVGFDVAETEAGVSLKTYDKGIDPETGQGLWGALMGPYEFWKLGDR